MSDPSDLLRGDGARWRDRVDSLHAVDDEALLGRVVAGPRDVSTGGGRLLGDRLPGRFAGRGPQLLSVAAVTVAALAVVGGVVLASGSHDPDTAPPALGTSGTALTTAAPPAVPSGSASAPRTHARSVTQHADGGVAPSHPHATSRHATPSGTPSTGESATAPACATADLSATVWPPTSGGEHSALIVGVTNSGTTPCTVGGFPTVQFAGDPDVTATPTAETAAQQTLAPDQLARSTVEWNGGTTDTTCPTYDTVVVTVPGLAPVRSTLEDPVQLCDTSTFVTHPLTTG